jgi:hypothetical protein
VLSLEVFQFCILNLLGLAVARSTGLVMAFGDPCARRCLLVQRIDCRCMNESSDSFLGVAPAPSTST